MAYLVDANVLCESSKRRPEAAVLEWLADHDAELHLSALSLGEMLKGIYLMDRGKRRQEIETWYVWRRLLTVSAEDCQRPPALPFG